MIEREAKALSGAASERAAQDLDPALLHLLAGTGGDTAPTPPMSDDEKERPDPTRERAEERRKPNRSSKFAYTSVDQIVTGKDNVDRSRAMSKLRRLVKDEELDAAKLLALVEQNVDALRPDEPQGPSEGGA